MRAGLNNIVKMMKETDPKIELEKKVEDEFLDNLKSSIELTEKKNARKPSLTYKPSGMNCIRQSYYQIKGYEQATDDFNYALIGICESGTDRHERIQKAVAEMKNNGYDCEYVDVGNYVNQHNLKDIEIVSKQGMETKLFNKKYNISFLCDGIIKYNGHYYIIEFKTESSYKFASRKGVDPSHYNQAKTYSMCLGLSDVLFVYISRDTLQMKAYLFNVTDEMRQGIIDYITECDKYLESSTVPPKPSDVSKKTCSYCTYKLYCKGDK